MAEKIVLPKAFSKEWYEYVWDYYRYHIIIGIIAVILAVVTVVQVVTTVKYDTYINFIMTGVITEEKANEIAAVCADNSEDLNNNGRVDIAVNQLNFTEENRKNYEIHTGLLNELMVLVNSNEDLLFVVDSHMLKQITEMKYTEDVFYKADLWKAPDSVTEGDYAVSLNGSKVFTDAGINSSDLFVLVARMDNEEGFSKEEENAINIANFLSK